MCWLVWIWFFLLFKRFGLEFLVFVEFFFLLFDGDGGVLCCLWYNLWVNVLLFEIFIWGRESLVLLEVVIWRFLKCWRICLCIIGGERFCLCELFEVILYLLMRVELLYMKFCGFWSMVGDCNGLDVLIYKFSLFVSIE